MKTILIIEDEVQIRNNLRQILHLSDFDTLVAENGLQGLELAKDKHPDLIICDLMMPALDGYGVLTQLRQHSDTATIPVIFLTAKSEWSDLRKGMELGADDYLTKPFNSTQLLQAIATRLNKQAISEQKTQEKLDDLRSSITNSLPHEINTPLNHIIGMSELLIENYRELDQAEMLEMLQNINQAGQRLHRLTVNFLMYADLELLASNPEKVAALRNNGVKTFVTSIVESVALKIAKKADREADLTIDISDGMAKIYPAKIAKIAEEIIENAFKFSLPNTAVNIVGNSNNNAFHLYVIDHGRGMTQEQINNVGAYPGFLTKILKPL